MLRLWLSLFVGYMPGISLLFAQVRVDTAYHYPVYYPIFKESNKPRVYIDGTHNNLHQIHSGFRPLSRLLTDVGFEVRPVPESLHHLTTLKQADILIIANAIHPANRGHWVNPTYDAFTPSEIAAIKQWVSEGGSLLLIADHMPFAGAAGALAAAFDIKLINGFTGVSPGVWPPNSFKVNPPAPSAAYQPLFTVDSVSTFTGSALFWPEEENSLLTFTAKDTVFITDTAWVFNAFTQRKPLPGWSQGGLMAYGRGKIAVFGEAAMFTAQIAGHSRVGFNSPLAPDNVHFILNCMLSLTPDPERFDVNYLNHIAKQQISERYRQMDTYFSENRMGNIASVYADKARMVGPYFKLEGREAIVNYWSALQDRGISWVHTIEELVVAGPIAFQTGTSKLEYTSGNAGETLISAVNYTIIWKKNESGVWEIYVDHYTKSG